MCKRLLTSILILIVSAVVVNAQPSVAKFKVEPNGNDKGVLRLTFMDNNHNILNELNNGYNVEVNGRKSTLNVVGGRGLLSIKEAESGIQLLTITSLDKPHKLFYYNKDKFTVKGIPFWLTILPPLIAILLALVFKEVLISLFAGIWAGAFIATGLSASGFFKSFWNVLDTYIIGALEDNGHLSIIVFSMLIGSMVAIISKNGGMAGLVNSISKFASSAKRTQLVTWFMGLLIFFDDYANTLIVGNTMRPLTDKFKISREKLAYIVDSTAAPVAAIAFVTTWIGAELGYIGDASANLEIGKGAYEIFLNSLKYSFYPILTLGFILMLILMNRDFGPMLKAENRARKTGAVNRVKENSKESKKEDNEFKAAKGVAKKWYNGLIPILIMIFVTLIGIWYTGAANGGYDVRVAKGLLQKLSALVGNSDSYKALLWGSMAGVISAVIMSLLTKTLSFKGSINSFMHGLKTMLPAVLILVLAWSLANVIEVLHTATFLTQIAYGNIGPMWLPTIVFVLAALIAFATGSSWGTMAILYPLALPAAWILSEAAGMDMPQMLAVFYNVVAVVLAGAVLGDHCSPISDTTILSSLASKCNHIDHVSTQMPYALLVGGVSVLVGGVFFAIGIPWYIGLIVGFVLLYLLIRMFGKKVSTG